MLVLRRKLVKLPRIHESLILISDSGSPTPCRDNPQVKLMLKLFKPRMSTTRPDSSASGTCRTGGSDQAMDPIESPNCDDSDRMQHQPFVCISKGFFYLSDAEDELESPDGDNRAIESDSDNEQPRMQAVEAPSHSRSCLPAVPPCKDAALMFHIESRKNRGRKIVFQTSKWHWLNSTKC